MKPSAILIVRWTRVQMVNVNAGKQDTRTHLPRAHQGLPAKGSACRLQIVDAEPYYRLRGRWQSSNDL
jgi:hypothetical protein